MASKWYKSIEITEIAKGRKTEVTPPYYVGEQRDKVAEKKKAPPAIATEGTDTQYYEVSILPMQRKSIAQS